MANVAARYPQIAKLVAEGTCFIMGDSKCNLPQRNGDKSVRSYIALRLPEERFSEMEVLSDPVEARRYLLGMYQDWDKGLKKIKSQLRQPQKHSQSHSYPISISERT